MTDIQIKIESTSLAFEAGAVTTLLSIDQLLSQVDSYEACRAIVASGIRELSKVVMDDSAAFLVEKGYKVGEYEVGMQRAPGGEPMITLTPQTSPVIGSEKAGDAPALVDANGVPLQ